MATTHSESLKTRCMTAKQACLTPLQKAVQILLCWRFIFLSLQAVVFVYFLIIWQKSCCVVLKTACGYLELSLDSPSPAALRR